ncbi:peptide deformylase [Candidatus Saccharibacteria bacterium]|nr:peptide deformylase [Candidatus Saccharibacteria bacterium]
MAKELQCTQFGNPILRQKAKILTQKQIQAKSTQNLIANMRYTMHKKGYGVALAAPQIAKSIALFIIAIKPNKNHPTRDTVNKVCINPKIIKTSGKKQPMWEGCMSLGNGETTLFGQTNRWPKLSIKYINENGKEVLEDLDGLEAHVFQHEYDHLQGILFVDKVKDTKTYMTMAEYQKRVLKLKNKEKK